MTRLILEFVRALPLVVAFILTAMLVQTAMSLAGPWPLKVILDNVVVANVLTTPGCRRAFAGLR